MSEQLLTARAIAHELGVTPATVLRWTREGNLPGVRLPSGQMRYDRDAFEAWKAARCTPGGAAAGAVVSVVRHDRPSLAAVPTTITGD